MKHLLPLVFAVLMTGTSQASIQLSNHSPNLRPLIGQKTTATKNVAVHALSRTQKKLQNKLHINHFCENNDDPAGPDELDLQSAYRRPKIVNKPNQDTEISNYVRIRLLMARLRAMDKYREVWAST